MSMAISPSPSTNVAWQSAPPPHRPDFAKDMKAVADLFGMSAADLKTQLASGKSLADVAQTKGVARTDLVSVLKTAMQANAPTGTVQANAPVAVPGDFTSHLDEMVNHIVDHKGMGGPPATRGQATDVSAIDFKARVEQMLASVASQLNLTPADLISQLEKGTSLSDIATKAGTTSSQLLDNISSGPAVNVLT
jgi:lambda repressor-like predicted transcriptional regulator